MSLFQDLVIANRILAEHGIIDTYEHISVRSPTNPERFWMALSVPPEQAREADSMEFDMRNEPDDASGRRPSNGRCHHGAVAHKRQD